MHASLQHKERPHTQLELYAPVDGEVLELSQVEDPVFSQQMMGEGVAIHYSGGDVYAPIAGRMASLFMPSCHAFILESPEGVQILVHVGLDTVKLPAGILQALCHEGDEVKRGQKILHVDEARLRVYGYQLVTPIVVLQSENVLAVHRCLDAGSPSQAGKALLARCDLV